MQAEAVLKLLHPGEEQSMGFADHRQQRRRYFLFLLQPAIEHLLDRPGRLAEIGETDHASAAFQCVEAAADRRQRVSVMRMIGELRR